MHRGVEPEPGDTGVEYGRITDVDFMDWRAISRRVMNYMTPFQWVIFIGLITFAAYKTRESWQIDDEIEKYAAETPGVMVDYYRWGKGNRESVFAYEVAGRSYRTSSSLKRFRDCEDTKWCLGKRYLIRYSSIHPEKGKVLWDRPLPRLDSLQHQ